MIEAQPKPDWSPLPRPGCENVEFSVLLGRDGIMITSLRFGAPAHIDKHDAPYDIDVICIDGSGYVSLDDEVMPFSAGQTITWPAGRMHCLWTSDAAMETLMVERYKSATSE